MKTGFVSYINVGSYLCHLCNILYLSGPPSYTISTSKAEISISRTHPPSPIAQSQTHSRYWIHANGIELKWTDLPNRNSGMPLGTGPWPWQRSEKLHLKGNLKRSFGNRAKEKKKSSEKYKPCEAFSTLKLCPRESSSAEKRTVLVCSRGSLPRRVIRIKQGLLSETAQRQTCSQYSNSIPFLFPFNFPQGSWKSMNRHFLKVSFSSIFYYFSAFRLPIFSKIRIILKHFETL